MALTLGRWTLIVALSSATLLVFSYPTDPLSFRAASLQPERNAARQTASRLENEIRRLRDRQEILAIEHSLDQAMADNPIDDGPVVLSDGNLDRLEPLIGSALQAEWKLLGGPTRLPIGVYVRVTDNQSHDPLEPARPTSVQIRTLLPDGAQRSACLRIVSIPQSHGVLHTVTQLNAQHTLRSWGIDLGPCGAYAAYGLPGPTVLRWLAQSNHRMVTYMSVDAISDQHGVTWHSYANNRVDMAPYSGSALGCAGGKLDQCRKVLLGETGTFRFTPPASRGTSELVTTSRSRRIAMYGWDFFGAEEYLLADLSEEFGFDKVDEFWSSSEPFATAFETMTGQTPGVWMQQWAVRRVGAVTAGPAPSLSTLTLLVGITVTALLWTLGNSLRRGRWRLRS